MLSRDARRDDARPMRSVTQRSVRDAGAARATMLLPLPMLLTFRRRTTKKPGEAGLL